MTPLRPSPDGYELSGLVMPSGKEPGMKKPRYTDEQI